jgi:D-erythrulose 1-phosphate 3-epimerase
VKLTLGINNCFAVKRWPGPDEWTQIVRDELGLDMVQHCLDLSDLTDDLEEQADAVRGACAAAAVTIDSVFTGLIAYSTSLMLAPASADRERGHTFWSRAIRFAARAGARRVGGHVGSLSRADADNPERRGALWSELQQRLLSLSELAGECGLDALLVENMACDREPWRMADLDSLLGPGDRRRAAVALCLDVGHQCVPGSSGDDADPYAWLRRMGPRTAVVHLQQSDAGGDHHWPFTERYNRAGRIDAGAVIDALAASGAEEVALVLEVVPPFEADDAVVLSDLRESVLYWRMAMGVHHEHV